jgi:uncharacterized protein YjbI with pentapeptide repeats
VFGIQWKLGVINAMADDNKKTLIDEWIQKLKNNPILAVLILVSVVTVGVSTFSTSFINFYNILYYNLIVPFKLESDLLKLKTNDINERVNAIRDLKNISISGKYQIEILDGLSSLVKTQAPWKPGVINDVDNDINLKDVKLALETIAQLPKKKIDHGDVYRINLTNVDISGLRLPPNPNLANLEGADLWGSSLRNVVLAKANLKGADLGGVDFTDASLEMADLEGAALWVSDAVEPKRPSIFDRTRLAGAILTNAHLDGAILTNAYDLDEDQIRQAKGTATARLPRGMAIPKE